MRTSPLLIACLLALSLSACAGKQAAITDSPNPPLATASIRVGPATVAAELALSETERERGLMFRKFLGADSGMIFVFPKDDRLVFWMKNTPLPLSLAYISSDGTIRQISELEPLSLAPVPAERSVRYALEMNRGWFDRAGVKVGDKVEVGALPPAED